MTLLERYQKEETWYGKVLIMGIYHNVKIMGFKDWTIWNTANALKVSVGLVSENLRIAKAIDSNPDFLNCKSRQHALEKLNEGGRSEKEERRESERDDR